MRITGLSTGLDVDSIIKETMSAYRTKIDQQTQKKDILEIKQKLYKDIMNESKTFYNKYFDILSSDSILNSSSWKSVSYTTTKDSSVKVTATSSAVADTYKITGTIATAAKTSIKEKDLGTSIVINGKSFSIDENISNKEKAAKLTADLKEAGINVSVKYSDFAGTEKENIKGFIFESTKLGANNSFTIGVSEVTNKVDIESYTSGANAKANQAIMKNIDLDSITKLNISLDIGKGDKEVGKLDIDIGEANSVEDKLKIINNAIKTLGDDFSDLEATTVKNDEGKEILLLKTKTLGKESLDFKVQVTIGEIATEEVIAEGKTDAVTAEVRILESKLTGKITINNSLIDMDGFKADDYENLESYTNLKQEEILLDKKIRYINEKLSIQGLGLKASASEDGKIIKIEANVAGDKEIEVKQLGEDDIVVGIGENAGKDAEITIVNSKGGVYKHIGTSNIIPLDGVTFTFTSQIPDGGIEVTGEANVDEVKDKIVKLFNDYNNLIEKLNTLTTTKRNRDYVPLTSEQKSELSEKEIELWEAKVEAGQLYKDSDLTRISNSLKEAMRTMVSGTGLTLERIGISPVSDYAGTKNGTFTIDENKLTNALETNMDNIKNMFVQSKPTDSNLSSSSKYSQTGIFYRIKDILYSETMISTSSLAKKAGIDGTASATNNTLYKSIKDYEKKIEDMESAFTTKESALYSKYATLETLMNNLNSQQSYLYQSLGISTS